MISQNCGLFIVYKLAIIVLKGYHVYIESFGQYVTEVSSLDTFWTFHEGEKTVVMRYFAFIWIS